MSLYKLSHDIEQRMIQLGEQLDNGETPSDEQTAQILGLINDDLPPIMDECRLETINLTADIKARSDEIERLTAEKKRLENRLKRTKGAMFWAMKRTGQTALKFATGSVAIQKNSTKSLHLDIDPKDLPEEFQVIEIKADTAKLKDFLQKDGQVVGASLIQGEHIRIR